MNHPTSQVTMQAEVTVEGQPGLYIQFGSGPAKHVVLRFTGPVGVQLMRSLALELTCAAETLEEVLS